MREIEQLYRDIDALRRRVELLEVQEQVIAAGAVTGAMLADDAVTNAKLRNSGALSVIGRSANSSGDPADISATAASGAVLRESGSTVGFGTVVTAGIADDAITNAKLGNMAQSTIKGRASGAGTGDPTDLTATQAAIIVGESNLLLEADGTVTGATTGPQAFTRNIIAPWVDWPLADTTNGNHFNQNNGSAMAGWTQVDAPQATSTNAAYGFWYIVGSAGDAAWKYRIQSPFNIESLSANAWKSFSVGPLLVREGAYTADINYYFGVYRNNAGVIDENTFVRLNLNWLAASSVWQMRGEYKDGTTQTNSAYSPLSRLFTQPLGVRIALQNNTNKNMTIYVGGNPIPVLQMAVQNAAVGSGVTWGQVWWQFHSTRGSGPDDRLMIGGIDYSNDS